MNPAAFDYHRAASVQDAVALLQQHPDAKLLAGGHSLLPVLKLRLAEPPALVDIGRIPELRGVREEGAGLTIGALTTHHQLATDPLVRERAPLLAETAARVGDRQVRNRGTFGGTLAHADAAADYPAAVLALEAEIVARGPGGERTIPAADFFVAFLTTALAPDEILTEVRLPAPLPRSGTSYQKLANQASGYAVVGVAAVVALDEQGRCAEARVGITGAAERGLRATATEAALLGTSLD
ncbi:MAG: xanthine dehydrogenase family protein subunit M, partial [Chloroflexota bacterium]|nr:xanthine dehydrogenase family protein subunit M [Chloroflexota bacterium]